MTQDKKMTAEEIARNVVSDCPIDHVVEGIGSTLRGVTPSAGLGNACETCIKQALLSYARQEVEEATKPLVDALEPFLEDGHNEEKTAQRSVCGVCRVSWPCSYAKAHEALTTHQAKYGETK